jgi:hypothetical protein
MVVIRRTTSFPGGTLPTLAVKTPGRSSSRRQAPWPAAIVTSYSSEALSRSLDLPHDAPPLWQTL